MINIEDILKKKGLSQNQIDIVKREVRKEFPDDEMMYELHLIRLAHSLVNGYCLPEDLFQEEEEKSMPSSH